MSVEPAAKPASPRPPHLLKDPQKPRDWAKLYASSLFDVRNNPSFADLEHFCLFIGYSRSGATLVGTVLNAHPEVVIAHELDAVNFVRHHFGRGQLFSLLLRRDQRFESLGRYWSGYRYVVPDQFQGRYTRLRVLGDKRARSSALLLARHPDLLNRIRRIVKVPIRVVHVTRNPFDNIATEARRRKLPPGAGTSWYEQCCEAVATVRRMLDPSELLDIRYETFAASPTEGLAELCRFVGVETDDPYLEACAGLVWPSTNRTRDAIEWSAEERAGVERLIDRYEMLRSYTFDD